MFPDFFEGGICQFASLPIWSAWMLGNSVDSENGIKILHNLLYLKLRLLLTRASQLNIEQQSR